MANSQKIENQLNLALDVSPQERKKTLNLNVGFDTEAKQWELIVKFNGSLSGVAEKVGFLYDELTNGYAVITITEDKIRQLTSYSEIEFIEKPKRLYFELDNSRDVSCVSPVETVPFSLSGEGVIVAIIDTGIDYAHPDFRNEDGTTRILAIWDQTIRPDPAEGLLPPEGFSSGTYYSREKINEALLAKTRSERQKIVPSDDSTGHGTHVAGIAAGNGRASDGVQLGIATKAELLIVKLGTPVSNSFPKTSQVMTAVDFCIRFALKEKKPVAVNLSFGNNYGSHEGNSILETFLNSMSGVWKNSIVAGTGNEGASRTHVSGRLDKNITDVIEISVAEGIAGLNIQIWKNFFDKFEVSIIHPSGNRVGPIPEILGTQRYKMDQTEVLLYYGEPQPSNRSQEIYIELLPQVKFLSSGIYKIELTPKKIVTGNYDLWLPSGGVLGAGTGFSRPVTTTTLTIPSTAEYVISVGAYNSNTDSIASFSGRGFTRFPEKIKPDLVAPGVDITSCAPGGGYTKKSGTSMAAPFVTGSAALLMQWGIVKGNDPYLYGEKIKAYLIAGTRKLIAAQVYPSESFGWGALCVESSLPV